MSEYIPLEFQEEILKRLPVKSLIQFRSVSKPWKSLIDSPDFIAAYGVRQTHPDRLFLRYKHIIDDDERYLTFVDNDNDHTFTRQDFAPKVPDPIIKFLSDSYVVGSSYGLLCFDYYDHFGTQIVVLWNLSISKSIRIEVPYMHDPEDENVFYIGVDDVVGFGVCPVSFDPTIVKIECFDIRFPWKVGVFTLSTGTWSILSTHLPRGSIRLKGSQVVIDRFIYWVAFDKLDAKDGRSQSHYLIMSFDLTAKEFKEINLTDSLTNRLRSIQTISKLRESLVLLSYHSESEEDISVCSLWMMVKERGVNRSFTKLYNINLPDATVKTLLGFRKTGELIMKPHQQYKRNSEVEIYDPNSEAIGKLGIDGVGYFCFMCSYMETLILNDQLDGFIYSIGN